MMQVGYLTIDDSPTEDFLNKVNLLSSKGIPAIFFCRGDRLEKRPDDAISAIKKGYVLGNHSYSHPNFSKLTLKECFQEIKQTDEILDKIYRDAEVPRPAKLFRFPGGDKGSNLDAEHGWPDDENKRLFMQGIQNYLKKLGYDQPIFQNISYKWFKDARLHLDKDVYWTYDTRDYLVTAIYKEGSNKPTGYSNLSADEDEPEGCRGLNYHKSSDIILVHDIIGIEGIFKRLIDALLAKEIYFKLPIFNM
ncbi:MAG: polysaccharide deacetylase family protein [Candidatus Heimdallarchaeota archaeon]